MISEVSVHIALGLGQHSTSWWVHMVEEAKKQKERQKGAGLNTPSGLHPQLPNFLSVGYTS